MSCTGHKSEDKSNQQKAAQIKRKLAQKIRIFFYEPSGNGSGGGGGGSRLARKTKRTKIGNQLALSLSLSLLLLLLLLLLPITVSVFLYFCVPPSLTPKSPPTHMGDRHNAFESKIFRSVTVIF